MLYVEATHWHFHEGMTFSAKDQDNDASSSYNNCATKCRGAWWQGRIQIIVLGGAHEPESPKTTKQDAEGIEREMSV